MNGAVAFSSALTATALNINVNLFHGGRKLDLKTKIKKSKDCSFGSLRPNN